MSFFQEFDVALMSLWSILIHRIWRSAGVCTHVLEGHSDAVTSVSVVKPKGITYRSFRQDFDALITVKLNAFF